MSETVYKTASWCWSSAQGCTTWQMHSQRACPEAWSTHCPYLTGTLTEYKAFFIHLGIKEATAVAWADA
eukprot:3941712-Rhodomonas_salina.2